MNWIRLQVIEVQENRELHFYGAALGFTHILSWIFWSGGKTIAKHLSDPIEICWQFFSSCHEYRLLIAHVFPLLNVLFILSAIMATLLWFNPKWVAYAYYALCLASVFKLLFYLVDYREMGNYHYMPQWVILVFLFFRNKTEAIRYLIVAFYIWAGFLKFNEEWLSGAAMFGHPILSGVYLIIGCFLVIVLECVASLFLLSPNKILLYFTLFLFLVFHLFSWHIVGFFYPMIMFSLLSIFVLCQNSPVNYLDFFKGRAALSIYLVLVLFSLAQLPPLFAKTDSALTGESRLTSLNMFDAKIDCAAHILLKQNNRDNPKWMDINRPVVEMGPRIRCEPWVYIVYAQSLCRIQKKDPDFENIDVYLVGRRSSAHNYQKLLDLKDVCKY